MTFAVHQMASRMAIASVGFLQPVQRSEQLAQLAAPLRPPGPDTPTFVTPPSGVPVSLFQAYKDVAPWTKDEAERADPIRLRVAAFQANARIIGELSANTLAATTGRRIFLSQDFECREKGFLEDICDIRVVWRVRSTQTGQILNEVQNPSPNTFSGVPKNGRQSTQHEFTMPAESVTIELLLVQPSVVAGATTGDNVADRRTLVIQWAPPDEARRLEDERRQIESTEGMDRFLSDLSNTFRPWVPAIVITTLLVGGAVVVLPHITKLVHGKEAS